MTGLPAGLKAYLRVPFVMIVWVMETYRLNRQRSKAFTARERIAKALKAVAVVTTIVWLAIAVLAKPDSGQRLTDAVQGLWSDTRAVGAQRAAEQDQKR